MKRILLILVSISFIFGMLAACAPKETTPEGPDSPGAEVEKPADEKSTDEKLEVVDQPPTGSTITLEYWQVNFSGWDDAIKTVIDMFEAENPNIKINLTPVDYSEINTKIAAMVPVGSGPDLVNPYYGWVPLWVKSGFLAPLPEDVFQKQDLNNIYLDAINPMYYNDKIWGVPLNQNNWAIVYNIDAFEESGITKIPETWDELLEAAKQCTVRDDSGKLIRAGYYVNFMSQEHILWKYLTLKNGQKLFSEDHKEVLWDNTSTGYEAFKWVIDLIIEHKVMDVGFGTGPAEAIYTGDSCMILGSPTHTRIIKENAPTLNFGTFPLPKGKASDLSMANMNISQYWSFNVTSKALQDPETAQAAYKFIEFLTRPEASLAYIKNGAGGLPVHKELLDDPLFKEDPLIEAFLATLHNSEGLLWVDEMAERAIVLNMVDKVLLNNEDPLEVFSWGSKEEQKLLNEFFEE